MNLYGIKGRVWSRMETGYRGRPMRVWYYEVTRDGEVYFTDNTASYEVVLDGCLRDISALARVSNAGLKIGTWKEAVSS